MNLLTRIKSLFTPTVDAIVADFTKAEKRLHALAAERLSISNKLRAKANKLIGDAAEHTDHAVRAVNVAKKIGSLLN